MPNPVLEPPTVAPRSFSAAGPSFSPKRGVAWLADGISNNGIAPQFTSRLRISVSLANWIIVACLLFTLPFGLLFGGMGRPELALAPFLVCAASFLLIRRGRHLAGRLFLVTVLPLTVYIITLLAHTPASGNVAAIKPLFFALLIVPLLVFRTTETRYFTGSLLFISLLLFTIDYADTVFPFKLRHARLLNLPLIQTVSTVEAVVFFIASLVYYKHLGDEMARQNHQLLQDMRSQNERTLRTNDELKSSAQQLKELNDAKSRLFSIIAHDLRSPMNSFRGFSGLLTGNMDALSKEDIKMLVKGMGKSFNNVNTLLENLLHWARMQMNTISQQPEMVDLSVLVADNLALAEVAATDKDIALRATVNENLYGYVDKHVFNVVLRNLLTNAVKFTETGGSVEVRAVRQGAQIRVEVADNGVGMSPTTLNNLFSATGHQPSTPGTANERGTGLGLTLCQGFVEQWGGTLHAASTKGRGSTFAFTLPAYQSDLFNHEAGR